MKPIRIQRTRQNNHIGTLIILTVLLTVLVYVLGQFAPIYLRAVALGR